MLLNFVHTMCWTQTVAVICRGGWHQRMHVTGIAKKDEKWIILSIACCIIAKPVDGIKGNETLGRIFRRIGKRFVKERMGHTIKYLFMKLPERNDTGGNKLTRQVNKRLMHSDTIKIVLILLQTKHATNALYPHLNMTKRICLFFLSWELISPLF